MIAGRSLFSRAAALCLVLHLAWCAVPSSCLSLTIGMLWDLSGPGADEGNASLRAAREAVRMVNASGGIGGLHLELLVADTQGKRSGILVQASRMIKQRDVVALVGPTSPGLSRTLQTMAESYEIPLILTSGRVPLMRSRGGLPVRWTFCSNPRLDVWGRALLRGLSRARIKTAAPLVLDGGPGEDVALWLRAYGPEFGVKVLPAQTFQVEDADVVPQLNWSRKQGADVAIAWGPRDWTPTLLRSSLDAGLPVAVPYTMLSTVASSVISQKALLIAVTPPVFQQESLSARHPCFAEVMRFSRAMEGLVSQGRPEELFSAGAAWDATWLVVTALREAERADRPGLRRALEERSVPYPGVMGVFEPDERNHCGISPWSQLVLVRGKGGWVPLCKVGRFARLGPSPPETR